MLENMKVKYDSKNNSVTSSSFFIENSNLDYIQFRIACGFISTTEILFVHEEITAVVTAKGNIEFYDNNKHLLSSISVPVDATGAARYEDICCKVENGKIMLRFPLYEWDDNYPHCDGEFDRWDARVVGYKPPILFDVLTHECVLFEK